MKEKSSPKSALPLQNKRRQPTQDRSMHTVDILFQAAAQILEKEGEAALTTNKVADVAGFSIGTLYQYFPNKDTLIQAMAQRLQNQVLDQIENYLSSLEEREDIQTLEPHALIDEALRIVVRSMAIKGKNKSMLHLFWVLEKPEQTTGAVKQVAERLTLFFERTHHLLNIKAPSTTEIFVMTRATLGVMRCASLEKSPLLGSLQLEDALSKMAWGLLSQSK